MNRNEINQTEFKEISMRARVAFGLLCLENALSAFGLNQADWSILLDQFWSYTNTHKLDDWMDITAEYLPESIINQSYNSDDYENISLEMFNELKKIYHNSNSVVNDIIENIFSVGVADIYSVISKDKSESLSYLNSIVKRLNKSLIEVPDIRLVSDFSFDESHGWGRAFNRIVR